MRFGYDSLAKSLRTMERNRCAAAVSVLLCGSMRSYALAGIELSQ
jgi:hypothetical protein